MIDVHYWPTPNGWKVTILLEECGLPYTIVPVDIGGGAQFNAEFLKLSPNNRMPAIVDHEPIGCLLYTSPSPRDLSTSRMPSSA